MNNRELIGIILSTISSIILIQLVLFIWYGKSIEEYGFYRDAEKKFVLVVKEKYTLEGIFKLSEDEKYLYISEISLEPINAPDIAQLDCSNLDKIKLDIRWDMKNNRVYYTENEYIDITTGKFTCP